MIGRSQAQAWLRRARRTLSRARHITNVARRLSSLGATPGSRLEIFGVTTTMALASRIPGWPTEIELRLRVGAKPHRVVVGDLSELEALFEVLIDDEYELPRALQPKVVLDLGSHIGASVIALKLAYPAASVIAVEPDPRSFARLTKNVAPFEGLTCLNVAAGADSGRRQLYRQEGHSWSSSLMPGRNLVRESEVDVCTLEEILARAGVAAVELVKFDVEGAEWELFPSLARLGADLLVGEIHFRETGPRDFEAVRAALPGFEIDVLRADKYGGVVRARRQRSPA